MEVDKERWWWGLVNFLLIASYFSVKESARSSAQVEAGGDEVRGEKLTGAPRMRAACVSSGYKERLLHSIKGPLGVSDQELQVRWSVW